jgi:hypothetical protein
MTVVIEPDDGNKGAMAAGPSRIGALVPVVDDLQLHCRQPSPPSLLGQIVIHLRTPNPYQASRASPGVPFRGRLRSL